MTGPNANVGGGSGDDTNGDNNSNGDNGHNANNAEAGDLGSGMGPEDNDLFNESLRNAAHDDLRLRLVHRAGNIKTENKQIRREQQDLEDCSAKLYQAEEGLKAKMRQATRHIAPLSYY